jgi:hypothetical protein
LFGRLNAAFQRSLEVANSFPSSLGELRNFTASKQQNEHNHNDENFLSAEAQVFPSLLLERRPKQEEAKAH